MDKFIAKSKSVSLSNFIRSASLALPLVVLGSSSLAQPLDIANEPLFLGGSVEPNVLMVIDDSGSMEQVLILSDEARIIDSQVRAGREFLSKIKDENSSVVREFEEFIDYTPDSEIEAFRLCKGFNVLAFDIDGAELAVTNGLDPANLYPPWEGEDVTQNPYPSMTDIRAARINPYDGPSADNLRDVSSHAVVHWRNVDPIETFEADECSTLGLGPHDYSTTEQCDRTDDEGNCTRTFDRVRGVETGFSASLCRTHPDCQIVGDLSPALQEAYANWYTYYRRRDFVAKAAILSIVNDSTGLLGLGTMHDNNEVGLPIRDMEVAANKVELMDSIARIRPAGGTPAREALQAAGEYFDNGSNELFEGRFDTDSPIFSEEDGGACQNNVTLLMTDGFVKGNAPFDVGNRDGDNNTPFDGGVYGDNLPDTLADVAMKYFETDMRTGIADRVRVGNNRVVSDGADGCSSNNSEANFHQHMTTFTAAFGVNGFLPDCNIGEPGCEGLDWPSFIDYSDGKDPATIDDLRHAAYNTGGEFLAAQSPEELIQGLRDAIGRAASNASTAAVSANSTQLVSGTTIFQGAFDAGDWSGNLIAFQLGASVSCENSIQIGGVSLPEIWNASELLNNRTPNNRDIITINANGQGIPFRWPTNATAASTADLVSAMTNNGTLDDDSGEINLNYLRGDRTFEGNGSFRDRANLLGDIISSSPVFVGAPRFFYPENIEPVSYESFKAAQASRTPMVYVGANDGMLHGFNAITGEEEIAYVPEGVFDKLTDLIDINYASRHQSFVDGTPTVADAYYDGAWHTILAGSLRAGGRSVFALDVTNPSSFSEANADDIVLWEFSDADLGLTFSQPDIVKTNTGAWAVIFGSGYNKVNAAGAASDNGEAHLFVVNAETGTLIRKIDVGREVADLVNGLATVTPVDANGDAIVDYIYGGDLLGNLWRFDLTGSSASSWNAVRLFNARSAEGGAQPITTRPSVAFHPDGQEGFLVMFGTGAYLENDDINNVGEDTQTFYAIWDKLEDEDRSGDELRADRSDSAASAVFLRQTIDELISISISDGSILDVRITSDNEIDWNRQLGWYMDLVVVGSSNFGERQVTNSVIRGDRIVFTTLLPDDLVCESGGNSFLMELSTFDGGRPDESPLDVNGDGVINQSDLVGTEAAVVTGFEIEGVISPPTILEEPSRPGASPTPSPTPGPNRCSGGVLADTGSGFEQKVFRSSTGNTESVLEAAPESSLEGCRQSWIEIFR